MKKVKELLFSMVLFAFMLPAVVFSATDSVKGGTGFANPLKTGLDSVAGFTESFLKAAMFIIFPIAVIFIVYSGFLFITAQGNPEGLNKAKGNFLWTIIGVALLLGAVALSALIKGTIDPILG